MLTIWNRAPSIHASLSPEYVSFLCNFPNQYHWNWSQILVFLQLIDLHGVVVYLNCQIYKNMTCWLIFGWSRALFSYEFCCMNFHWYLSLRKCIQDLVVIQKHMIMSSNVHPWENIKHEIQTHMRSSCFMWAIDNIVQIGAKKMALYIEPMYIYDMHPRCGIKRDLPSSIECVRVIKTRYFECTLLCFEIHLLVQFGGLWIWTLDIVKDNIA